jgi:uncharacterized protein (DUF983 family)
MYLLKSCPRCSGDLFSGADAYESYLACVQCGHYVDQAQPAEPAASLSSAAIFRGVEAPTSRSEPRPVKVAVAVH